MSWCLGLTTRLTEATAGASSNKATTGPCSSKHPQQSAQAELCGDHPRLRPHGSQGTRRKTGDDLTMLRVPGRVSAPASSRSSFVAQTSSEESCGVCRPGQRWSWTFTAQKVYLHSTKLSFIFLYLLFIWSKQVTYSAGNITTQPKLELIQTDPGSPSSPTGTPPQRGCLGKRLFGKSHCFGEERVLEWNLRRFFHADRSH